MGLNISVSPNGNPIKKLFREVASVPGGAPVAGTGVIWLKDDAPNKLFFTGDDNVDRDLTSAGVTDHGALTGLPDDDHSQYALLAGRSSGQILVGAADASGTLTLRATANADDGAIIFETDPTTERMRIIPTGEVGIGTATPTPFTTAAAGFLHIQVNLGQSAAGLQVGTNDEGVTIGNGTGGVGEFAPQIFSISKGAGLSGLQICGAVPIAEDTGTLPGLLLHGQRVGGGELVTRPSISFRNSTTELGQFTAAGALLIGTATPTGSELLKIAGAGEVTGNLIIGGALDHDGSTVGFFSTAPVAKATALTAVDATAIDSTYDAVEEAVLNNVRTRLNELEARIQAYGFLP